MSRQTSGRNSSLLRRCTNGMLVKRNADLKNLKHELPAGIYIIGGKKVYVR